MTARTSGSRAEIWMEISERIQYQIRQLPYEQLPLFVKEIESSMLHADVFLAKLGARTSRPLPEHWRDFVRAVRRPRRAKKPKCRVYQFPVRPGAVSQ